MKTNAGGLDRVIRAVFGIILVALTLMGSIGAWGWLGLALIGTAAIGWCPPYQLLGFSTCATRKA
jgi:hypothetical protein